MSTTNRIQPREDEIMVVDSHSLATAVLAYAMQCLNWPADVSAKVRFNSHGENADGDPIVAAYLAPVHSLDNLLDIVDRHALGMNPDAADDEPEGVPVLCVEKCDAVFATLTQQLNLCDLEHIAEQIYSKLADVEREAMAKNGN